LVLILTSCQLLVWFCKILWNIVFALYILWNLYMTASFHIIVSWYLTYTLQHVRWCVMEFVATILYVCFAPNHGLCMSWWAQERAISCCQFLFSVNRANFLAFHIHTADISLKTFRLKAALLMWICSSVNELNYTRCLSWCGCEIPNLLWVPLMDECNTCSHLIIFITNCCS